MAMTNYDKGKFFIRELFMNENGKVSGSGFIGIIMGLAATLGFVAGIIGFFWGLDEMSVVLEQSIQFGFYAVMLMSARKLTGMPIGRKAKPVKEEI